MIPVGEEQLAGLGTWLGEFYDFGHCSVRHRCSVTHSFSDMLTPAMLNFLSKNSTTIVHNETEDEVLARELKKIAKALNNGEAQPMPAGQPSHFDTGRMTAIAHKDVKHRPMM